MLKWSARQHFIHYSYFFFRALSEKKNVFERNNDIAACFLCCPE